jgi:hypothetical protein
MSGIGARVATSALVSALKTLGIDWSAERSIEKIDRVVAKVQMLC